MLFKDVPESKLLTKNSRFVYSEDDEHLKYIRDFYFRRGYQEVSNEYGTDEPGILGSQTYELMNYDYNQTRQQTYIYPDVFAEDSSDWYVTDKNELIATPVQDSEYYREQNDKINWKLYWFGRYSDISKYNSEMYSSWNYNQYDLIETHSRMRDVTREIAYDSTYSIGSVVYPFFPLGSYEFSFKVRLHNISVEESKTYYCPPGMWQPEIVKEYHAHLNNGMYINFDGGHPTACSYFKDPGQHYILRGYYLNGTNQGDGEKYGSFGCMDNTQLMISSGSKRRTGMFHDLNHWQLYWMRDALDLDLTACEKYFGYKEFNGYTDKDLHAVEGYACLYNSYFIKFGNDSDWHEYTINVDPDDIHVFKEGITLSRISPTLSFTLSGMRPLSRYDSYIEFKDMKIKSKPYKYSEKHITDVEHFYVNKSGVWLPDNFVKIDDNFTLSQVRTNGSLSATARYQGYTKELYTKPIVMTADATANYQTGTKVCDILVNDVPVPIMYPITMINGAETIVSGYSYNLFYNGKMTFYLWKNYGLKYTSNKYIYVDLPKFSGNYNFGNVNLNGTNSTTFEFYSSDIKGALLFEVYVDISTSAAYIPDDDTEYIKLSVQSSSMINYISGGVLEKRIPMSLFKNQMMNHKKIKLEFLGYIDGSYYSYSLVTNVVGKLKSGATLTANALKVTVKYNRIGPTTQ